MRSHAPKFEHGYLFPWGRADRSPGHRQTETNFECIYTAFKDVITFHKCFLLLWRNSPTFEHLLFMVGVLEFVV